MPDTKDVILAVLGASVGLAGLLLVFSGFVFSQAATFPSTTSDETIEKFEKAGRAGVWPFLLALAIALISFGWLLCQSRFLYILTVGGFIVLILATGFYGAILFWSYL